MPVFLLKIIISLPFFFIGTMYCTPSFAELGDVVRKKTVQTPKQRTIIAREQSLTVYQEKLSSGMQIKEYVNANNIVVAVSWRGPTLPNFKQLLGKYANSFTRSLTLSFTHRQKSTIFTRNSAELMMNDLVVQSQGHLRSFFGKAYLPKLLPPAFDINQIK